MRSIDKYIRESILSSTKAGKYALLDRVMKAAKIVNYSLEVVPGHKNESIVIDNTDKSYQEVLHFEKSGIDAIKVLKIYDGILIKTEYGIAYPDYIYFGNISNCDINLSCFDFSDENISSKSSISDRTQIRFIDCTNINITDIPFCTSSAGHDAELYLINTSLSGINTNCSDIVLSSMGSGDGKKLVITDLDVFKDCRFKQVKLTDEYFKNKYPEEYNKGITDSYDSRYVKNCFNDELDKFIDSHIIYSTSDLSSSKKSPVDILTTYSFKNLRKSNNKEYKYMLV